MTPQCFIAEGRDWPQTNLSDSTQQGNIPDGPNLIIVPVNLHAQFTNELRKYLQAGAFDIFPYILGTQTRLNFWTHIWPRSVYSEDGDNRKILVASINVSWPFVFRPIF